MRIAILGTGDFGSKLGKRWSIMQHAVCFAGRRLSKAQEVAAECSPPACAATVEVALRDSETIVMAVPWDAAIDLATTYRDLLDGKVVIDCTNPVDWLRGGELVPLTDSVAEAIARAAPQARVVKAFNTQSARLILNPTFGDQTADAYLCTDDDTSRSVATQLATELGFRAIDAGPLRHARHLEHLAALWIHLALQRDDTHDIAIKMLER